LQPRQRDLTQVKGGQKQSRIVTAGSKSTEVVMPPLSEPDTATVEQSTAEAAMRLTAANKHVRDFMIGAQKLLFEEAVFAGSELFERSWSEMHLLSEFVSKMAGSHSVKDLRTMGAECAQHQLDFIRRDSDRIFKHGERMIEATTNLFNSRPNV
jgi:hypothetical protein